MKRAGIKKKNYSGIANGTAARFLITRLEPAGAAVFAMLKCSGGDAQQP